MANVKFLGKRLIIEGQEILLSGMGDYLQSTVLSLVWLDSESGRGFNASFVVKNVLDEGVYGQVFNIKEVANRKSFTVILGACRPQMLKRIMEIVPTFPIKNIVIVASENAEKSYLSSNLLKEDGYLRYLEKGVEQAGIPFLPEVQVIDKFWSLGKHIDFQSNNLRLVCDGRGEQGIGSYAGSNRTSPDEDILLAIGPESGWSEKELEDFRKWNFNSVHLGEGILRVDVALISSLSILRGDIY